MLFWAALAGCADKGPGDSEGAVPEPVCEAPGPLDDTLTLAASQALGTHNSTHIEPETPLDPSWEYTMRPLSSQLDALGMRQIELDIHLHKSLGYQVFHLPGVDDSTTCLQLSDCLIEIKDWSDANPCHLPLTVWIEPKDDIDEAAADYQQLSGHWDDLEAAILEIWPVERLIRPDDVRGGHATLPDAIAAQGWPTLAKTRGKVLFALLDSGEARAEYLAGTTAAEGKLIFPRAEDPAEDFAAIFKLDDPVSEFDAIQARVAEGFLVTCTADGVGDPAEDNAAGLELALSAGCQSISTNAPAPDALDGYSASVPEGTPARCNPVSAPEGCTSEALEDLR